MPCGGLKVGLEGPGHIPLSCFFWSDACRNYHSTHGGVGARGLHLSSRHQRVDPSTVPCSTKSNLESPDEVAVDPKSDVVTVVVGEEGDVWITWIVSTVSVIGWGEGGIPVVPPLR